MIIGITGGVGCGKSEVLALLENNYHAHVIVADAVAHQLMRPGHICYDKIIDSFGEEVLEESREINRKKLSEIVFKDRDKLILLNQIIHPEVKKYIKDEIASVQNEDKDRLIVIEAALLIEAGYQNICNELWYIYAEEETRTRRLMVSRAYSEEKIKRMIANQLTDTEFRKNTKRVIDNNGKLEHTLSQIEEILGHGGTIR